MCQAINASNLPGGKWRMFDPENVGRILSSNAVEAMTTISEPVEAWLIDEPMAQRDIRWLKRS